MADISGASLSITRPVINNGVNPQRESENQDTDRQLRATSSPQQGREINQQPADVPPEESISSRLDISVSGSDNTTQENTTVTREQVVLAVEQQLQQNSVNSNAARSTDEGATEVQQSRAESTNNQTSNQTSEQLATSTTQTTQPQEVESDATEIPLAADNQDIAANAQQNQPTDSAEPVQASDENRAGNAESDPNQTANEQSDPRNPATGLGLESGSIIDTIA